jgi:8-oxo-dGTP pyrophosphatase MutT (NUDIX family)
VRERACRPSWRERSQPESISIWKMSTSAKKATATSLQYAALPFRRRVDTGRTEVMLVTSLRTGRWIIPKGWPMKQEAPHAASAREALEEAGIVGEVGTRPIGSYTYQKQLKQGAFVACEVHVFPLEVKRQQRTWPEKSKRQVQWFSSADAAAAVQEPALSEIIRTFQKLP